MSIVRTTDKLNSAGLRRNDPLRHLDIYLDAGMRVVGLDGKTPAETGWPKVPFRPRDQIPLIHWDLRNFNFGCVLDDTTLVVDVDRHSGKEDGWQSLTQLAEDLGTKSLVDMTPAVVETGGGGMHLYFSKPSGMQIRKTLPNYPGLDFCSKGQQVVAVGAVHPDSGRPYTFAQGKEFGSEHLRNLPPAPAPLLNLLSQSTPDRINVSSQNIVDNHEHKRVIAALSHIDPDLPYTDWIRVLTALHSIGQEDIFLPIADDWSAMGGTYETAGHNSVESKWKSFDNDPMREPRITVGTLFRLAKEEGWDGSSKDFGLFSWQKASNDFSSSAGYRARLGPTPITDILATKFKPLSFIVKDLIPDTGTFLLSSNPKVGKTTFCHQMCLALMGEVSFLGEVNPKPRRILFLALEDSLRRIKRRTEQIRSAPDFDLRNPDQALESLMVETDWPIASEGILKLDDWLSKNPDTDLVVIDTLAAFRGMAAASSRNVYQGEYDFMKRIKKIADKNETSILLLHHNRKAVATSPGEAIGGSYGLTGAVDGYMVLECRAFADSEFLLSVQGREIPPQELALKRENFIFRSLGDASTYSMSPERREIVDMLRSNKSGLGPMEIARGLGRTPVSTRKLLTTMQKRGLVKRLKHGVYASIN
jgi:hypothetical protein